MASTTNTRTLVMTSMKEGTKTRPHVLPQLPTAISHYCQTDAHTYNYQSSQQWCFSVQPKIRHNEGIHSHEGQKGSQLCTSQLRSHGELYELAICQISPYANQKDAQTLNGIQRQWIAKQIGRDNTLRQP